MMTLLLALLCQAVPADPGADVMTLLKARGMSVEPQAAARAASEAVVRLADPGAQFFDEAGAAVFEAGRAGTSTNPLALKNLGEGIVLLKPERLDQVAADLTAAGLADAAAAGGGFILDCRGTSGTNLSVVDAIASCFTSPDTFLYAVQDSEGEDLELHAASESTRADVPVFMLIDKGTSGTAELLAAVLARDRGVMLMGNTTQGDAARRELTPLAGGGYAFLATGRFVLPDGATWAGKGVEPHVRVSPEAPAFGVRTNLISRAGKPFDEPARRHLELFTRIQHDPGLARAVDLLLGLKALALFPEKRHAPIAATANP